MSPSFSIPSGSAAGSPRAAWSLIAFLTILVQAMPLAMAPVAGLGHGLYHLSEQMSLDYLREGHVHGPDTHVHPDGGSQVAEHGHSPAVDGLLALTAATDEDELSSSPEAPPTVDVHLPGDGVAALPAIDLDGVGPVVASSQPTDRDARPDSPPPRA